MMNVPTCSAMPEYGRTATNPTLPAPPPPLDLSLGWRVWLFSLSRNRPFLAGRTELPRGTRTAKLKPAASSSGICSEQQRVQRIDVSMWQGRGELIKSLDPAYHLQFPGTAVAKAAVVSQGRTTYICTYGGIIVDGRCTRYLCTK